MLRIDSIVRKLSLTASLLGVTFLVAACGEDGGSTTPESTPTAPARILVLQDGATDEHVAEVLDGAGFDVTLGGNWWEYEALDVAAYDAVFLLNGYNYSYSMTQAAQERLATYVAQGGGLVATDWIMYYRSDRNGTVCEILPVTSTRDYGYEPETYTRMMDHPVAHALPDSFTTTADWTWVEYMADTAPLENAQVVFSGSKSGAAVVVGEFGLGRTIGWGTAGAYNGDDIWTPQIERLVINMARWLSGRS